MNIYSTPMLSAVSTYCSKTFFLPSRIPEAFRQRSCSKLQAPLRASSASSCRIRPESVPFLDPIFAGPEHGHRTDFAMSIGTRAAKREYTH